MKSFKTLVYSTIIALALASCSMIYPVGVGTGDMSGSKVGTAQATVLFGGFLFNEDASIKAAAENGGITKIAAVDVKVNGILGLFATYTTTVTGE